MIPSEIQPTISETFYDSVICKRMSCGNSNTSRFCVGVVGRPHASLLRDIETPICESWQLINMTENINRYSFWRNEDLKKGQSCLQPEFSKRGQSYQSDSKMMKMPFRIFYIQTAHLLFSTFQVSLKVFFCFVF